MYQTYALESYQHSAFLGIFLPLVLTSELSITLGLALVTYASYL